MYLNNIETVRKYEKVARDLDFKSLEPYEKVAITKYFINFFSQDLLDQLYGWSLEPAPSVKFSAFEYFMGALTRFTLLEAVASGEVHFGEGGITRKEGPNVKAAYAKQVKALKTSYENNGYLDLNQLVDLMNDNPGVITEWPLSPGSLINDLYLIKSSKEFIKYYSLYRPFQTFQHLAPSMLTQQDFYLRSCFDEDLIDELIENDGLVVEKTRLRTYLVQALVKFTIALGLEDGLVRLTKEGIRVFEEDKDTGKSIESMPDLEAVSTNIRNNLDLGQRYVDRGKKYMIDHPTVFPPDPEPECPPPIKHPHIFKP